MRRPAMLLALALLATPAAARAQAAPLKPIYPTAEWYVPRSPEETGRRWYGWQILIADAAADAAVTAAYFVRGDTGDALFKGFLATQMVAPLIIHSLHSNPGRGVGMFYLRFAGAIFGAFGAACLDDEDPDGNDICVEGYLRLMVPALVAQAIDIGLVAWHQREWPQRPRPPAGPIVAPVVTPHRGGATIGLAGSF